MTNLGSQLYAIHSEIFAGVSGEQYLVHVLDPPAEWTLVQLYFDAGDALIGDCAAHAYCPENRG